MRKVFDFIFALSKLFKSCIKSKALREIIPFITGLIKQVSNKTLLKHPQRSFFNNINDMNKFTHESIALTQDRTV